MATTTTQFGSIATRVIGPGYAGGLAWGRGSPIGFVDSVTGDWCYFVRNVSTSRTMLVVSIDQGQNWSEYNSATAGDTFGDVPHCVAQDSTGAVHAVYADLYTRVSLTRSGGHVTGWDYVVANITVPANRGTGYTESGSVCVATNGSGTETLVISMSVLNNGTAMVWNVTCSHNATPSAAADFYSLTGTSNSYSAIALTGIGNFANDSGSAIIQHPTTGAVWVFYGSIDNETNLGAGKPYGYCRLDQNAANWTAQSPVVVGTSGATDPWVLSNVFRSSSEIGVLVLGGAGGLRIDKINASNTYVANAIAVDAGGYVGHAQCNADFSKVWCAWIATTTNASTGTPKYGVLSSGSWAVTTGSSASITLPFFSGIPGIVSTTGLTGIVAFYGNQYGNNYFRSSVLSTPDAQVGGTLSYTATGGAIAGGASAVRAHPVGVQIEAVGAIAFSAASGTTVSPSYAGLGTINPTYDGIALIVGQKPSSANGGTVTTPTGFTLQQAHTAQGGYSTTLGADTGNTNLRVYTKDTVTGSESGTLAVTVGTNNVAWAVFVRYSRLGAGAWQIAAATAADTTAGNISLAFGSDPGVSTGDLLLLAMCIPTDVNGTASFSAQALSQTGVTFGTVSEAIDASSGNGNDIGAGVWYARALSGTSSAAPTFTATGGTTTTNLRGPGIVLRIREAAATSYSYTAAGGGLGGGAAAQKRTVLDAVSGGAIAGGAVAMKRALVALVAGGAIAGGAAQISTATAHAASYTASGGAIGGGSAKALALAKVSAVGGGVAGGSSTEKRTVVRATAGGGVVGGSAPMQQISKSASSGGAVAGGAARESRVVVARASGGAVAGGAALTVQPPRYTAQGGGVGGGAAYEKRAMGIPVSGGGVGGGAANEKRTVAIRPSTGAVAGGAATVRRTNAISSSGGAVAGGAATEKRAFAYVGNGGALAGGASVALRAAKVVGSGGGIAGGFALWSSSAPVEIYYGADGGAVAGGSALVVRVAVSHTVGGAIAGGSVRSSVTAPRSVSGGAVAGGSATERRAVKWVGVAGALGGGASPVTRFANAYAAGGAIAGGSARVQVLQSGFYAYSAVGGAIAGGVAGVLEQYVARTVSDVRMSINFSPKLHFTIKARQS